MEPSRVGLTTPTELAAMKKELTEASELKSITREKRVFVLKIIMKALFCIVLITSLLFLMMISLAKKDGSSPSLLGFSLCQIKNDRMSASLPSGSFVLTQNIKNEFSLNEGDTVIYTSTAGTLSVARIVQKYQDSGGAAKYTAKFDNSKTFPELVTLDRESIRSVFIFKVPYIQLN